MINAWSDNTYPWSFGDVSEGVLKYFRLRLRLLPYIYRTYAEFHRDGIPVTRSMELMYGDLTTRLADDGHEEFRTQKLPFGREKTFVFENQYFLAPIFLSLRSSRVRRREESGFPTESGTVSKQEKGSTAEG